MKFTNEAIKKEKDKLKVLKWVWILLFILCFMFLYFGYKDSLDAEKNIKPLHEIIINEKEKEDKLSYVDITVIPYKFAVYDGKDEAYYFIADKDYIYVTYIDEKTFDTLKEGFPKKITGITKPVTSDIKKIAIDTYNEGRDEDKKLLLADYDNYFGSVYLDLTTTQGDYGYWYLLFFLTSIFAFVFFITERVRSFRFKRSIKKLDDSKIMKMDAEMNDKDAFYYSKAHLYLTKSYIINFLGKVRAIEYNDIVWIYPFEVRTNGIKTSQSIMVVTKDGKRYNIANLDIVTKAKKEMFNEIFNTIISKNKNMIVGYTKEAREKAKEILQKYKEQK